MGFMDKLNHLVSDIVTPASNAIGMAFDAARMGKNASEAASAGVASLLATEATGTPHIYAPKKVTDVAANALNAPLEYLVDRPLQTPANLIRSNLEQGDTGLQALVPDSPAAVLAAYQQGAHQSAGQAYGYLAHSGPEGAVAASTLAAATGGVMGPAVIGGLASQIDHPDTLGETAQGRGQLRNTDIAFNIGSGTSDFVKATVLDPLNVVSGGVSKAKAAEKLPLTAKNMNRLANALNGKGDGQFTSLIDSAANGLDHIRYTVQRKAGRKLSDREVVNFEPKLSDSTDVAIPKPGPGQEVATTGPGNADFVSTTATKFHVPTADLGASTIMEMFPAVKSADKPQALATALAETFRIDDDALRHQAYRDIWAAAAGDVGALGRLKQANVAAAAAMDRAAMKFNPAEFVGDIDGATVRADTMTAEIGHELQALNLGWIQDMHKGDLAKMADTLDTLGRGEAHRAGIGGSLHNVPQVDFRAAQRYVTGKKLNPFTKVRTQPGTLAVDIPGGIEVQDSPSLPGVFVAAPIVPRMNRISRILNAIPHELANKLPHGFVDMTNDTAAYNEIGNMLNFAGVHPSEVARTQSAMAAATSTAAKVAVARQAEHTAVSALAERHGLNQETADFIFEHINDTRQKHLTGRLYSAARDEADKSVQFSHDVDGNLIAAPPLETQQLNTLVMTDLVHMNGVMGRAARKHLDATEFVNDAADAGMIPDEARTEWLTESALHNFNKLWKFQVLFRLGYPIRNMIDNDVRMWAKLGGQLTMQSVYNRLQTAGVLLTRRNRQAAVAARMAEDIAKRHELQARVDSGDTSDAVKNLLKETNRRLASVENYKVRPGIQGDRFTVNGVELPAPFEGVEGASFRQLNMGSKYSSQVNSMSAALFKTLDTHGSFEKLKGTDPGYFDSYARLLNNEISQDAAMQEILVKGRDQRALKQWFSSAAGKRYLRNTGHENADLDEYAHNLFYHANYYTPGPLREIMREQQVVTPDQLRDLFPDVESRPEIHGQKAQLLKSQGVGRIRKNLLDTAMKVLGDIPDDELSRHPMFAAAYRAEMKRQVGMIDNAKDVLTGEDIAAMATHARHHALNTVKGTLYDSDTYTNAARMMRFISPFFSAWQEGATRVPKLVANNPHPLWFAYKAWNAPNRAGFVVDQNGNPVKGSDLITDQDMLVLKVPNYIARSHPGWWDESNNMYTGPQARISKNAFNLWIQGDPFYSPGVGPLAEVPMDVVVKAVPSLNDSYKALVNGYGVPENWYDPFLGATTKRIISATRGPDDQAFAQAFSLRFQDNMIQMRDGQIPHMSADDMIGKTLTETRHLFMLRAIVNAGSPFPPVPSSKFQFFRDEFMRLQQDQRDNHKNDPEWATREFMQEYGDVYFPLTQSISENNAGVQATSGAVEGAYKYSNVIGRMHDAKMAASIIGSQGQSGNFNLAAYRNQQSSNIITGKTGAGNKYRSKMDPADAARDLQVEQGWYKYNQLLADLNAVAIARGGDGATYKDFPDLSATKSAMVQSLAKDENGDNTAWYQAYMGFNPATYEGDVLHDMRTVTNSPTLKKRADVKLLNRYLTFRDEMHQVLDARRAAGGSATMTAQSNADLAATYRAFVGSLANANTQFNLNWYQRWIDHDPYYVSEGVAA